MDRSLLQSMVSGKTLVDMFCLWEREAPDTVFLRQPVGKSWREYTYGEAGQEIRKMARALMDLGLPAHSHIGLLSKNCAHWIMADLAIVMAGHVSVPFFTTISSEMLSTLISHSEVKAVFIGKIAEENWDDIQKAIPPEILTITFPDYSRPGFKDWSEMTNTAGTSDDFPLPDLDDLYTIIYTSGTTANPKGVMHSFRNIAAAVHVAWPHGEFGLPDNRFISYLPLSHVAERGVIEAASIYSGGTVSFVESIESFPQNLRDAQVTHFLAVPRIWEKFQQKIHEKLPPARLDNLLRLPLISGLIKRKIRKSLGLQKARLILTGAAPIPVSLLHWYHNLGIEVREAYGMTENFNICCFTPRGDFRPGYVGKVFDEADCQIDSDTGEIMMKVPSTMIGYFKNEEETRQSLRNGFLYTGDTGELTPDGFLKITGRIKDLFKTAKGKYVSPSEIESGFISHPIIEQVCVSGDGYSQPYALIVLTEEAVQLRQDDVKEQIGELTKRINRRLHAHERIDKVVLLEDQWTISNQLLTPTLKMKRAAIQSKYSSAISSWLKSEEMVVWSEK